MSESVLQITLELPETWGKLPERERNSLILAGVYEATRARVRQLQDEIAECERHVRRFEKRYGVSLQRFEAELLPTLDTLRAHEDYNDWFYWQSALDEKKNLLSSFNES